MSLQADTPKNEPDKSTPKQEALLVALMQHPTMQGAATACKLSETTVWRMMKEPAFAEAYQAARRQSMEMALSFLQKATGSAAVRPNTQRRNRNLKTACRHWGSSHQRRLNRRGTHVFKTPLRAIEGTGYAGRALYLQDTGY